MNSEDTLQASALRLGRGLGQASAKEEAARAALEECAGRTLSDLEWERARARLLDFVSILHAWQRKGTTTASALPMAA
jgi:hypothetical protein